MSDKDWKPEVKASIDVTKLDLSAEEGFVLSRLDGSTSVENLSHLTGMAPDQIGRIMDRLTERGAVARPAPRPAAPAPRPAAPQPAPIEDLVTIADGEPIDEIDSVDDLLGEFEDLLESDVTMPDMVLPARAPADAPIDADDEDLFDEDTGEDLAPAAVAREARAAEPEAQVDAPEPEPEAEEAAAEEEADEEAGDEDEGDDEDDADGEEEEPEDPEATGNYRKLYSQLYKEMERDLRVKYAREEDGAKLCALCFDPDPGIIRSVFENMNAGRQHARLVAEHHRTATGISHLARQHKFLSDSQVQRFLLRNVQTPDPVLIKMLSNKPIMQLYRVTTSRELSDRAKRQARQCFRKGWTSSSADQKVALLFKTEGRCLNSLIGLTIDQKSAQLICARTIHSVMLIQSLCRFPATPPLILTHLNKSAAVRRAPHLKKLILQHPNCPSAIKRGPQKGRR